MQDDALDAGFDVKALFSQDYMLEILEELNAESSRRARWEALDD